MSRAILLGSALVAAAGWASAAPSVEIRHAAARVIVYPEARSDVAVQVSVANRRLPLRVTRLGETVIVDGGLGWRMGSCHSVFGRKSVGVFGVGAVPYDQLPQIIVRTPLDARIGAGPAVFGEIDRSRSLEFANSGCGDWTIANVAGHARISQSGSGDARVGSVGAADVNLSGSGDVHLQGVGGGLNASTSGSGDVGAARIGGAFNARVAGSGNIKVDSGYAPRMNVEVAGSGDVTFGGVAGNLAAAVAGSGDVNVARVTGAVARHVAGSGSVNVGR